MFDYKRTPTWSARKLAKERVRRGVAFLNQYAPIGWQRCLFNIGMARDSLYVSRRFKTDWGQQDVISLAFEGRADLARADGRISAEIVADHFGLSYAERIDLGFYSDKKVPGEILDEEWERAVATYAAPSRMERIHAPLPTAPRRKWAA